MSKPHEIAHETFGKYAGMDAPHLPEDRYSSLQTRLHRWQVTNFGVTPAPLLALGIAEEVGELLEGITDPEMVDAAGDAIVFACQLATTYRLDLGELIKHSPESANTPQSSRLTIAVGRICHTVLKAEQGIRGFEDKDYTREHIAHGIMILISAIDSYTKHRFDPIRAWEITAEAVMERDWKSNRMTGAV